MNAGAPRTVAVDLTPVLPAGENGGAKIFALELVRRLASAHPETRFVLLTQSASHAELRALEAGNVRRELVVAATASALRGRLFGAATRVLSALPSFLRRRAALVGYRAHALLKRGGTRRLLRDMGADLLFCPFTAPTYSEPGIPVVCTLYDLQFHAYPQFFSPDDVVSRERAFLDACKGATALAAISEYSRRSAIAFGKLDPTRIRTIPLRLAASVATATSSPEVRAPGRGRFFLYPANFWKHKNHEMLLAAFGIARRAGLAADIKLVCTGQPGARQTWLREAADLMGLGAHVEFPGFLPEEQLRSMMSSALGVIFPSLYEGFGLPVVEAMAAGIPVACSDIPPLPEVAHDAALLFDPRIPEQIAQAMSSLANDAALHARLAEAGKLRAREFSDADLMAREYWDLFAEACAKASRPA